MVYVREPVLDPVSISALRPTQITVGMREVEEKRRHWRKHDDDKKGEYLGKHMIPVVLGPKQRPYVIDHHHLSRALHEEGVKSVLVSVVKDLRHLARDEAEVWRDVDVMELFALHGGKAGAQQPDQLVVLERIGDQDAQIAAGPRPALTV